VKLTRDLSGVKTKTLTELSRNSSLYSSNWKNEQFNNLNKSETITSMFSQIHVLLQTEASIVSILTGCMTILLRHFFVFRSSKTKRLGNIFCAYLIWFYRVLSSLRTFLVIHSNFQSKYTTNNHLLLLQQCLIEKKEMLDSMALLNLPRQCSTSAWRTNLA